MNKYLASNMDYFQESDDESIEQELSWRLDPEESLSDWTIVIQNESSGQVREYNVHKNILAVGPCKSEYFATVFRSQMMENETNTSRIALEDVAADAIPLMLDWCYSQKLDVSSEFAVALRYLAQYFGIKLLYRKVMAFVKDDMNMTNVHHYIQTAKLFHDEKMLSLSLNICIQGIQDVEPSSQLLQSIDLEFFHEIISSPEVDTCSVSCHISKIVAAFCCLHEHELDEETFEKLTDRRFIPLVAKESAMILLELESRLFRNNDEATCLQKRCTNVLAQHWKDFAEQGVAKVFRKFPSVVIGELLYRTVAVAQNDMNHCRSSVQNEIDKHTEIMNEKLQQATAEVQRQVEKECSARQRVEEELQEARRQLKMRDRELSTYKREWKRMVRIPVNHVFPRDVKRCTYHHQSGNEPFDNPSHLGQYGKVRPTAMPNIGDAVEDGYLFLRKSGHYTERWPMFYYCDR